GRTRMAQPFPRWLDRGLPTGLNDARTGPARLGASHARSGPMAESAAARIQIYLIDDHPIVREGFARAIMDEPDMVVVGQAGTAGDALKETALLKPDVVLVDLNIPDRDGIELLGALRAQLSSAKLMVLSGYDDEFRVAEALRAGAQGYLV